MKIPNELIEHFSRGNGTIFIGAGLSIGAGLPGWGDLIQRLKGELEDCPADATYPDIAQYYVIRHGKNRLITRLREELDTFDIVPTVVHKALVQLKISPLFTTNYDDLLEKALQDAGIRFDPVVSTVDASFWTSDRIQLVKFHGDITQPSTVVLTSEDYERYFPEHPALTRLLSTTLQTRTLLLLGYSATDIDFRLLLTQVQSESGSYARNAYAAMFDAPGLVIQDMERRGIKVINFVDIPTKNRNETLSSWIKELGDKINSQKQTDVKKSPEKKLPLEPYKFLNWFGEDDIAIFHGRDYEIKRLASLVETQRITILYGESGTGKTSLLKAGVIPMLRDRGYLVAYFRPLTNPVKEAEETLKSLFVLSQDVSSSIQEIIIDKLPKEKTLLIILDQFEEFFIRQGVNTRKEFEKVLKDILDIPDKYVHILFSLRSDYLDRLDEFEDVLDHDPLRFRIRLHNLGSAGASAAIMEPAKDFGINLDQALLEKLLSDLGQGWVAPPQLQIVCYSLWKDWVDKGKPSKGLSLERYFELGSTEEILANYLTRVIQDLSDMNTLSELSITLQSDVAQNIAKAVLKSLITSERTKITVSSKEITHNELIQKLNINPDQIDAILRYLQNRRIVRHIPDSQYYELVHEVMINQIWSWVSDDERRLLDIQDILQRAITDYRRFRTLLSPEYLNLISENINKLSFSEEVLELLLNSSINYNYMPNMWVERMMEDQAITVLEKIISTQRKMLYPQIASALGHTQSPKAVRYLDELCREESKDTQRAAALAMAKLKFRSVVPPLFHALMREERLQRAAPFLEALELIQHEDATAALMLVATEHKDVGVRKRATNSIMKLNSTEGIGLIVGQLNSNDTLIRASAIGAIEDIFESKPRIIINIFKQSGVDTRMTLVRYLSNSKSINIFELLTLAIEDNDPRIRLEAIRALGNSSDSEKAFNMLLSGLQDKDDNVRFAALEIISAVSNDQASKVVIAALEDSSPRMRQEAINILGMKNEIWAVEYILAKMKDHDANVREAVARILIKIKREKPELLVDVLRNHNSNIKKGMLLAIGEILPKNENEELIDKVYENNIAENLESASSIKSLIFVIKALRSSDVKARRRAATTLGRISDVYAIDALINALNDADPLVRRQVVIALAQLKDERIVNALFAVLNDEDALTQEWAQQTLGQASNLRFIDVYISHLTDKDTKSQQQAAGAILSALTGTDVEARQKTTIALSRVKVPQAISTLVAAFEHENIEVPQSVIVALDRTVGNQHDIDSIGSQN